jgi:hypothetical protein
MGGHSLLLFIRVIGIVRLPMQFGGTRVLPTAIATAKILQFHAQSGTKHAQNGMNYSELTAFIEVICLN